MNTARTNPLAPQALALSELCLTANQDSTIPDASTFTVRLE